MKIFLDTSIAVGLSGRRQRAYCVRLPPVKTYGLLKPAIMPGAIRRALRAARDEREQRSGARADATSERIPTMNASLTMTSPAVPSTTADSGRIRLGGALRLPPAR